MSRIRLTRWCGPMVLVALVATSCSNSSATSDASESQIVVDGLPRVQDTTVTPVAPDLPLNFGPTSAAESASQIVFDLPEHRIISDGGSIREVDSDGNELVLATVAALEIGADPAEAERFGRIDVGPGRLVLAEVSAPDQTTSIVLFGSAGARTIGEGTHPGVDANGRFVVFADSGADGQVGGTANVLTQSDLNGSTLGEFVAGGLIVDVAIDPAGGRVGVLHEVGRSLGLTIVSATTAGLVEGSSVAVSGDTTHIAFVGENTVALASFTNGVSSVSIIDVLVGSIISQVGLDGEIADLDWSASGDVGLVVTIDGEVLWLAGNATGRLTEAGAVGGRW